MKGLKQQSSEVKKRLNSSEKTKTKAKLLLVGAGPGDPELLTIKAINALKSADIILYDNLVNRKIFDLFSHENKEFLYVGKKCSEKHITQEEIHGLILENLNLGKRVLRLKGGDPFIFARGVEEMFIAKDNGFDVEVIPGLSSGISVPALNGIPLTLREKSDAVMLVTGHQVTEEKVKDWAAFLKKGGTLVIYMGLHSIEKIQNYLFQADIDENMPAIAIQEGSLDSQIILRSNLANLVMNISEKDFHSPTLIVIGKYITETLV